MTAPDRSDDFERGLANRRAVLGDEWVDRALEGATDFNADFQSLITRYAWNDVWGRPGLDHETRRLLVLGMTMGLARWEEFELHCRAAIRGGVAVEKIQETLLQGAIYCGVPAANTAFKITGEILRAEGKVPAAAPLAAASRVAVHHTFSAPQLRIAVEGKGAPVVLSHALGLDLHMWDALARRLAAQYSVLRYDHRGHGGSARPPGPYGIDDLVDDAARVIREWGRGPVAWIGLSMGGMVGQGLAVLHPELLRGAVLANTVARYPEAARPTWEARIAAVEAGGMAAVADAVVERYLHADYRAAHPEVAAKLKARLLRTDPAAYLACCHAIAKVDWLDRLAGVRVPTLVIAGARDVGATPEMARAIAERIAGAELQVFEDASHLSVVETPDRFHAAVAEFLGRVSSRATQ
ncbi:MAG: bifunctional 4-carboxymuconolactone decarboxylase/3-oxoadipate enol-lactonase PcaCD [Caldimonas sp.]